MILRIDVSRCARPHGWRRLSDKGIKFSFVRATYGATVTDNLSSTTARKVERGLENSHAVIAEAGIRCQAEGGNSSGSHEKKRARNIRASLPLLHDASRRYSQPEESEDNLCAQKSGSP